MMNLNQTTNALDDDETVLDREILAFIHYKELYQFQQQLQKKSDSKSIFSLKNKNAMQYGLDLEEVANTFKNRTVYTSGDEESGDEDTINKLHIHDYSYKKKWDMITEILDKINSEGDIDFCIIRYTGILKLHIEHRIQLDVKCFNALLYCKQPEYIKQIFDLNLFDSGDKSHIGCLFENESLFNEDEFLSKLHNNQNLVRLVESYTVLFYRADLADHEKALVRCLNCFVRFLNNETFYNDIKADLKPAVKNLVKAVILNGVFTNMTINSFLSNTSVSPSHDSDSDMSNSDVFSSGEEDRMDFMNQGDVVIDRRQQNNINDLNKKNVGERIGLPSKSNLIFPLSLKNICRIRIKNCMSNYNAINVRKLKNIPSSLRQFILFNDEISC